MAGVSAPALLNTQLHFLVTKGVSSSFSFQYVPKMHLETIRRKYANHPLRYVKTMLVTTWLHNFCLWRRYVLQL